MWVVYEYEANIRVLDSRAIRVDPAISAFMTYISLEKISKPRYPHFSFRVERYMHP
ncbi:hypothetical protein S7335_5387 [Synechococcus sp. PCC 7335]|nr:hypothetical protein S7335_5387 [Synechococcus sp. PCC 7335]